MSKTDLQTLKNRFEELRQKGMDLNNEINKHKNYWSRSMLWAQHKLSRKLARERNEVKRQIELHENLPSFVSDSSKGWKGQKL